MTKLLLIASVFLTSNLALAQTFKVVKIQGKKAIVEVSDPSMISVNQSYNVGDSSMPVSSGKGGKREHAFDFDFNFTNNISNPSTGSSTTVSGSYLWNFKTYEVGPILALTSISPGGSTTTFGGKGFYNFTDNKPGVESLWAVEGLVGVSSGSGQSATVIEAGGNYRWFALSPDHCLSASLVYHMAQATGVTASNLQIRAGIITYF